MSAVSQTDNHELAELNAYALLSDKVVTCQTNYPLITSTFVMYKDVLGFSGSSLGQSIPYYLNSTLYSGLVANRHFLRRVGCADVKIGYRLDMGKVKKRLHLRDCVRWVRTDLRESSGWNVSVLWEQKTKLPYFHDENSVFRGETYNYRHAPLVMSTWRLFLPSEMRNFLGIAETDWSAWFANKRNLPSG